MVIATISVVSAFTRSIVGLIAVILTVLLPGVYRFVYRTLGPSDRLWLSRSQQLGVLLTYVTGPPSAAILVFSVLDLGSPWSVVDDRSDVVVILAVTIGTVIAIVGVAANQVPRLRPPLMLLEWDTDSNDLERKVLPLLVVRDRAVAGTVRAHNIGLIPYEHIQIEVSSEPPYWVRVEASHGWDFEVLNRHASRLFTVTFDTLPNRATIMQVRLRVTTSNTLGVEEHDLKVRVPRPVAQQT